jgi:hypothetical protein
VVGTNYRIGRKSCKSKLRSIGGVDDGVSVSCCTGAGICDSVGGLIGIDRCISITIRDTPVLNVTIACAMVYISLFN